ncbi:MAG: DUF262 domain-containing protein, partial [Rhizonema sp. PD37]|nr:DUF262 domain-containing protein [Rhizonema sp. PD37]
MTDMKNLYLENSEEDAEIDEDEDIEPEDASITTPFDPTEIRVDTRPMTIDLVLERIKYEEINLAPDFQRHADIWTPIAKSRLIESILIRIPLPAFYMDATNEDKWLVIDGLQRLSTLKKFAIDNELRLKGLEFFPNLEGKNYKELPRNYQRRIRETVLTIYLIEKGTPPEVKFNIFRRINTGGEPLSPQELRHALNPGQATKFLDRLAKYKEFRIATNITKKRQERMDDHEFILGFVAFYLTPYKDYPIKQGRDFFLNESMLKINAMSQKQLNEIAECFQSTMITANYIFGKYAFRKVFRNHKKLQPLNKSLFEAWSVILSKINSEEIEILKNQKELLLDKFISYIE